jgi:DNA-binding IclR family transcriptional regulator
MEQNAASGTSKTIKSIDKTFDILEFIQEQDGARITEIADHLNISKGTVHSHLATLERRRYVVNESDVYRIGYRFLNLGGHATTRNKLHDIAKNEINDLASETGETANFIVEEFGWGIYLIQSRGRKAVMTDSHIGKERLLHCTAAGKAILANMTETRIEEVIDRHGLPALTENTLTSREALDSELEEIRDRGVALDDEELIDGIRCVATPILDEHGIAQGAISISGPTKRMTGEKFRDEIPDLLTRTARIIEINAAYD